MRPSITAICVLICFSAPTLAGGPADRIPTDPQSIVSDAATGAAPLPVDALLLTLRISGIAHSRDDRKLAFTSNASGRLNLWVMNVDGTAARQLVQSNERQSGARFSHDGAQVVYAQDAGGNELYDLFAVPTAGGEPRNLTHTTDTSEFNPEISPDGTQIAFSTKKKVAPIIDIAVMDFRTGAVRTLTLERDPKALWNADFWSRDGKSLFATRTVGLDDADIYRIDVASGRAEKLFTHAGKQLITSAALSRDEQTLLVTSNAKGGFSNVALLDLKGKKLRWLTDTQWSASAVAFSPDGASVLYTLNADGRIRTLFLDLKTGKESERGVPVGMNLPADAAVPFLADGSVLLLHEDSSHPQDLYALSKDGRLTQITHNASEALQNAVLPRSQIVTYQSFDGRLISAFVWVPFNLKRDGSAAAVVMPHGGPTGQTTDVFNGRAALLASRGFLVIAPNVRGSTGYGMEFQNANIKDLGGADLKDEIAGVDFLKASGFVDAKRIGIWGGSYGGFMSLMAIGKAPEVWAAAVDEYGILNWLTMLKHEDARLQEYEKTLLGDPVRDRSVYEASSPLKYIRNAKAPLLVLQGDNDIRVPREEAEQVVALLKGEGRTVEATFYPDEGHGFIKREHQQDELSRSVAWLHRYLQSP